ncbi:MAG: SDR family NAD(P)-dependent oxidoreductase, partial [Proteobacteria bacterium]|nr:SDR family NAD(P)-dependent oxidoreductase [Pseudomonadota bacterium]
VVTGAGSGIGRSLALAFAKRGMKIVVADVDEQALNTVSAELTAVGAEVLSRVVDVSDRDQVAQLADATYDRFGRAHILCNNAGVGSSAPIQSATLADWDWVLGVNQFGVIYGTASFLPRMLESGEPCHIVNTASVAGHMAGENAQYSTSKFAVVSMSESLRTECFNTNVGVSVLCPNFVSTGIMKNVERFRSQRSGLFQPTDEMMAQAKPMRENFEKFLNDGMSPDVVAEKVMVAIQEDILHVITHPETLPLIEARFEAIRADTMKLDRMYTETIGGNQKAEEGAGELKTYQHDSPAFRIRYSSGWKDNLNPPPWPGTVFYALKDFGAFLLVQVFDKSNPGIPPDYSLESATSYRAMGLVYWGTDIRLVSDRQTTLEDGTPASVGEIEFRQFGSAKRMNYGITVFKEDKWISVVVGAVSTFDSNEFKEIVHSLTFV